MTRTVALLTLLCCATTASARPLELVEVLDALEQHPTAAVVDANLERADGEELIARGAFDVRVRARAERTLGYYDRLVLDGELRKLTRLRGLSGYVGWRLGSGEFPDYDLKFATFDRGEVRAGVDVPLLRDGSIDRARADERKVRYGVLFSRADRARRLLDLERDAALTYWDWVAAGHRLTIRERQLALAKTRDRALQRTIAEGSIAPIEGVDNARVIAAREAAAVGAQRDFTRAALELSFYLRQAGAPVVPGDDRLPSLDALPPPLPAETDVGALIAEARQRQPALAALVARLDANRIDLEVANNQLLPSLNAGVFVNRGIGTFDPRIPDRDRPAVGGALTFELPIERSAARGAAAVARADRRRLQAEQQSVLDRIAIDARAASTELDASRRRSVLASDQSLVAVQLADAERLRFERGDSTILIVNLREEAAGDAAAARIDAMTDYFKARARYVVTMGRSLKELR